MAAPRPADLTVTLTRAQQAWLARLRERVAAQTFSPRSARAYASYVRHLVESLGRDRLIDEVEADEITAWLAHYRAHGMPKAANNHTGAPVKASAVVNAHKSVGSLFDFAAEQRWVRENPMRDVAKPRAPRTQAGPERRALAREELDAMIEAARTGQASYLGDRGCWIRDEIVIRLAGESGLRNDDICQLDLTDIECDPDAGWVARIRCGKGRKARTAPLTDACAALITDYVEHWRPVPAGRPDQYDEYGLCLRGDRDALLLTAERARFTGSTLRHLVARCAKAALGRHYVPHGLRHTTGTLLAREAKADPALIAAVLGHNDISTTSIYLDTRADEAAAAVNRRKPGAKRKTAVTAAPPGPDAARWPECGTREGWNRHRKEGGRKCTPCLMWKREDAANRELRAAQRALAAREREYAELLAEVRDLRERLGSRNGRHGTARAYREHVVLGEQPCERCEHARLQSRANASPCGTEAGSQWHRHWGEPDCEKCRAARLGNQQARKTGRSPVPGIRTWARRNGFQVSSRGRIADEIVRAWMQAQNDNHMEIAA